jgi:tetratricopeptide (TPR) repeat protein
VYLGELGQRRGVDYDSRRLDPEGQSFVFRAAEPGTYALKFYKEDFIRDYILNDYVQVIVGEGPDQTGAGWFNPPIDRGRVIAEPRWPAIPAPPSDGGAGEASSGIPGPPADLPAGLSPSGGDPGAAPGTGSAEDPPQEGSGTDTPREDADIPPGGYIGRAQAEYDAGRIASALEILGQFRERFPAGSDEAWWLYGQILEANSPARDIRSALDYYRRLVREYPQSSRYDDARRRIAYLERYYFNIP